MNFVASRGTDFSQQVSLTTSRQASAPEQLINQRQKCRDTVVFYWLIHKQPFPNKLDLFPVSVFFWLASKFCAYEILVSHQSGLKSLALVRYV